MSVHTSLTYSRQAFLLLRAKTSRQPFGISRSASHSEYCSSIFTRTTYSRVSSSSMGGTLCQPHERGVPERYYASLRLCPPPGRVSQNPSLQIMEAAFTAA